MNLFWKSNSTEVSEFEKVLKCSQFLENHVVPVVKEKEKYPEFNKTVDINRTYLETKDAQYVISFKKLYFPELNKTYFAGIFWNLDSLKIGVILNLLEKLEVETNLEFQLADNKNNNLLTGDLQISPRSP